MIKESKINDIFRIFVGRYLIRAEKLGIGTDAKELFKKESYFACNNVKKELYDKGVLVQDVEKNRLDPNRVNTIDKPENTVKVADK